MRLGNRRPLQGNIIDTDAPRERVCVCLADPLLDILMSVRKGPFVVAERRCTVPSAAIIVSDWTARYSLHFPKPNGMITQLDFSKAR